MTSRPLLLASVALSLLTSCRGGSTRKEDPTIEPPVALTAAVGEVPTAKTEAAPAKPAEFKLPKPTAPGYAYFELYGGIAVFEPSGKVSLMKGSNGVYVEGFSIAPDGIAYAMAQSDGEGRPIYKLDGTTLTKVASTPKDFLAMVFAAGKGGTFHVAGQGEVVSYDGKSWSTDKVPDAQYIDQLMEDSKGRLWVSYSINVAYREAGAWKAVTSTGGSVDAKLFGEVGGSVVSVGRSRLFKLEGDKAVPFGPEFSIGGSDAAMSDNGIFALPSYDGKTRSSYVLLALMDGSDRKLENTVNQPRIDSQGRLWSSNDGAVNVIAPDGTVTEYPLGSIPELASMSGLMFSKSFLVTGAGPALPPVGTIRKAKAVKGKLLRGAAPIANVPVEICVWVERSSSGSPCAGKKSRQAAVTNDKGEFVFNDVPLGNYDLALQEGGAWSIDTMTDIKEMRDGTVKDLGTIRYAPKKSP